MSCVFMAKVGPLKDSFRAWKPSLFLVPLESWRHQHTEDLRPQPGPGLDQSDCRREEFGPQEREFLVRRRLGMTERQWESLLQEERDGYLARRLWESEAWRVWEEERLEQERLRHAMSGRSKQERRWERKGDHRMTFDENYDWE